MLMAPRTAALRVATQSIFVYFTYCVYFVWNYIRYVNKETQP